MSNFPAVNSQSYDPYFYAAYTAPNLNSPQNRVQLQNAGPVTQQTNTAQTQTKVPTTVEAPINTASENIKGVAFKGTAKEDSVKKGSTAGKLILTIASLAALAYGGYKCHGKGIGDDILSKVKSGAKQYWNDGISYIIAKLPSFKFSGSS